MLAFRLQLQLRRIDNEIAMPPKIYVCKCMFGAWQMQCHSHAVCGISHCGWTRSHTIRSLHFMNCPDPTDGLTCETGWLLLRMSCAPLNLARSRRSAICLCAFVRINKTNNYCLAAELTAGHHIECIIAFLFAHSSTLSVIQTYRKSQMRKS